MVSLGAVPPLPQWRHWFSSYTLKRTRLKLCVYGLCWNCTHSTRSNCLRRTVPVTRCSSIQQSTAGRCIVGIMQPRLHWYQPRLRRFLSPFKPCVHIAPATLINLSTLMTSVEPLPRAFADAEWCAVGLRDAGPVSSSCKRTLVKVWRRSLLGWSTSWSTIYTARQTWSKYRTILDAFAC